MTGIESGTNSVRVTWDGPPGYYQLFGKPELNGAWQTIGRATNYSRQATVPTTDSSRYFRVAGPAANYSGVQTCRECHENVYAEESQTAHARAFTSPGFVASGAQDNPFCLPCHTVGYRLPTGFVDKNRTPHLAGVQCENCHGPSGNHAANPDDPGVRPRVEVAAAMCGGCHTGSHHPTYDEWQQSGHAVVTEDMNPSGRISSCGRCHSGTARESLIKGQPLPAGDANVGIVCTTCHDPHQVTANPAQLRYPLSSTNDYFLSTTDVFADKYDPNVNICGQCHNHRGASWTGTSRPPHHSPQYNMLLGTVGELEGGLVPQTNPTHAKLVQDQCVGCHMTTREFESESHPGMTGHTFKVESFESCRECHPYPELLYDLISGAVDNQIQSIKRALDQWALTKAPEALRTKYGARAWEYTNPGSLSSGGSGPTTSEQAQIPANIKKARFNLYLVLYDGSLGTHNPSHTAKLLDAAEEWVWAELLK